MPGGKRYKFAGSTIQFSTGYEAAGSPSGDITAITRANPAVVTHTAHGKSDGDVVIIRGANGMTEVNDDPFVIEVVNANSYQLLGVDSTDYGTYTGGGEVDEADFSNLCELTSYNRTGGQAPEIKATSLCSTAQEYEVGLPDFGTAQADYNFAPQTTVQQALQASYLSGEKIALKITLPNSGGIMVQLGTIQQTSESVAEGDIWKGSLTLRCTGQRYDFAAA